MFDRCTLDEAAAALAFIPADERETWVQMGMAVHHEFGQAGFETWDAWSQSASNYKPAAARDTYKSFKARGGGITIATLFNAAIEAGYQPEKSTLTKAEQQQRDRDREQRAQARKLREQAEAELELRWHDVIAVLAVELVGLLEFGGKAPYLGKKRIKPFGAMFVPRGLLIQFAPEDQPGYSVISGREGITQFLKDRDPEQSFLYLKPGYLVVPLYEGGQLQNLQVITDAGKKLFLKHGRKSGLSYLIGDIAPASPIVFVEGFATGASVHMATGHPVVVCLDAGNLPIVARQYASWYSAREHLFVIAGDSDQWTPGNPGATRAREAANDVGGVAVLPLFRDGTHG